MFEFFLSLFRKRLSRAELRTQLFREFDLATKYGAKARAGTADPGELYRLNFAIYRARKLVKENL